MKNKGIVLFIMLLTPCFCFSQGDSVMGSYTIGGTIIPSFLLPTITLGTQNVFTYNSGLDVGDSPETEGRYEKRGDTVFFSYPVQINPIVVKIDKKLNIGQKGVRISLSGNLKQSGSAMLYVNHHIYDESRYYQFDSTNTTFVDSISSADSICIYTSMNTLIPMHLDLDSFNDYHYKILLPLLPSIYYLTDQKAFYKNGLLYFFKDGHTTVYFNLDVYSERRTRRRIEEYIKTLYETNIIK